MRPRGTLNTLNFKKKEFAFQTLQFYGSATPLGNFKRTKKSVDELLMVGIG